MLTHESALFIKIKFFQSKDPGKKENFYHEQAVLLSKTE